MEFTGERFVPSCQGEIAAEHYHRYFFAAGLVSGKHVLDIASGEGYGARILAQSAARVTGVDIFPEAVANATQRYAGENISFLEGGAAAIPLPDASVDVTVSFETLEHLHEQEAMIGEIRRVLRDDGLLVISTPNKSLYRRDNDRFHVRELFREEFLSLLKRRFAHVSLLGQRVMYGSLLSGAGGGMSLLRQRGEDGAAENLPFAEHAMYFIALAGNGPLPPAGGSFFDYPLEKSDPVARLRESLADLQGRHDALRSAHDAAQARLETMEAAYASILASRSWRVMAPLRRLRRLLRGARKRDGF